jgi:hypothetical protein
MKDGEREARHVMRMRFRIMRAPSQLHHHAAALVGELFHELDAGTILGDVVGDDSLAQGWLAKRGLVDAGEL